MKRQAIVTAILLGGLVLSAYTLAQDYGILTPVYVPLGEQNKFPMLEQDRWLAAKLDRLTLVTERGPRWLSFTENWQWRYMTMTGPRDIQEGPTPATAWHSLLDTDYDGAVDLWDISVVFNGMSR